MPTRPPLHRVQWHKPRQLHEAERKARFNATRPTSNARGYNYTWQRLRLRYLAQNPFCSMRGCMELATDVDHITSIKDRPDLRLQWWNLRSYCHRHHSRRTAIEQGFARRAADDGRTRGS